MGFTITVFIFVFIALSPQVPAQRQFFGPPPTAVNRFFASCFQRKSTSVGVNWRSITDFVILHASWYDNSNAGACAPTGHGPDFTIEADCWKEAFAKLISPSSSELQVATFCVDRLVAVATQNRKKRSSGPFIEGESLDSRFCPPVDPELFTSLVAQTISVAGTLPQEDRTLEDLGSIIEFVKKAGTCNEPVCNRCDIQFKDNLKPNRKLSCNQCWPTRLAGMIKNSSPLKIPITFVVTRLGQKTNIIGPPPPFVNRFFGDCINSIANDATQWNSVTDFVILHTSWYDNSNAGACAFSKTIEAEAKCWKRAFGKVISSSSPLLRIVQACVDRFVAFTHGLPLPELPRNLNRNPRTRSRDSRQCPDVSTAIFARALTQRIQETTIPSDFFTTDTTLNGTSSIIKFVQEAGVCRKPTCNECRIEYNAANNPRRTLKCSQCWATRLAGMVKSSSPLKIPAVFASIVAGTRN